MNSTNSTYRYLLNTVIEFPERSVAPRSQATRERIGFLTTWDMQFPIITIPSRKLNYRFMMAEAYWILRGYNGLNHLTPYNSRMSQFSDDGVVLNGAYGPKVVRQLSYIASVLKEDPDSRQAVLTVWERNPSRSKDIPCTISMQFLLRDGFIHTVVNMRSSDVWWGIPYDIFTFSMITQHINGLLGYVYHLGRLSLFTGSQHIYEKFVPEAKMVQISDPVNDGVIKATTTHGLKTPDDPIDALGIIRECHNDIVINKFEEMLCRS